MRTDWDKLRAGDVVQTRNGQRFVIGQVITRDLPIDFNMGQRPCVIAASTDRFEDDMYAMWYFLFSDGNHFTNLQDAVSNKRDGHGNLMSYYTGCIPSQYDAIGYYKGYVQQSLFV